MKYQDVRRGNLAAGLVFLFALLLASCLSDVGERQAPKPPPIKEHPQHHQEPAMLYWDWEEVGV